MASVILAASGAAFSPGKGINTNIPEIRANTSKNPYSKEAWTAALPGITRQIAKESNRVRGELFQHPRHEKQKSEQESRQARNGAESGILQRRRDLDNVHHNADRKAYEEQRRTQQQGRPESLTNKVNGSLGTHASSVETLKK
jgi:hypothetical protein